MHFNETSLNQFSQGSQLGSPIGLPKQPGCNGRTSVAQISVGLASFDDEEGCPTFHDIPSNIQVENITVESSLVIFVSCSQCNFFDFTEFVKINV
jgi:hypothetical protein